MNARLLLLWSCLALTGCAIGGAEDPAVLESDSGAVEEAAVPADETAAAEEDTGIASDTGVAMDSASPVVDSTPPAEDTKPEPVDTAPDDSVKKVLTHLWKGQETGYWCGPGSARIALSTKMASPPSQTTLAKFMGTTTAGTDYVGLVVKALNSYLSTTRFKSKDMYDPPTAAQRAALKADILANIRAGYGMVANVVSGWRPPGYPSGTIYHYVAIVGYDAGGDKVLIADPAAEGSGGSSWGKVPRTYWVSVTDLGTWIGGKGYTGQ